MRTPLTAEEREQRKQEKKVYGQGYWDAVRGVKDEALSAEEGPYTKGHVAGLKALEDGRVSWTPKRQPKQKAGRVLLDGSAVPDPEPKPARRRKKADGAANGAGSQEEATEAETEATDQADEADGADDGSDANAPEGETPEERRRRKDRERYAARKQRELAGATA